MRVEVKIPGGVKTHVIDERGNKFITSKRMYLILLLDKMLRMRYGQKLTCQV